MPPDATPRAGVALLIGIGDYRHGDRVPPLRFAAADAEAMAAALTDPDLCHFPPDQVVLLTDHQARRDALADRLARWLPQQAQAAEIVVLSFAGHGLLETHDGRDEGYLAPCDADPDDLAGTALAMSDVTRWVRGLTAGAVVVCLDCCHAGKALAGRGAALRA